MVDFNGTYYAYVHTLQGDIGAIVDNTGTKVVEYGYDAWGKPTKAWSLTHPSDSTLTSAYRKLARLNPFCYRGYVWDEETGLYSLRSRYYDPAWGRFTNSDCLLGQNTKIPGHNIFAYCGNKPILCADENGALSRSIRDTSYRTILPFPQINLRELWDILTTPGRRLGEWIAEIRGKQNSLERLDAVVDYALSIAEEQKNNDTIIYRWYAAAPTDFIPHGNDVLTGLSFSTTPGRYGGMHTTIGDVAKTGMFLIYKDPTSSHVAVIPYEIGEPSSVTLQRWQDDGIYSQYTWTLYLLCAKDTMVGEMM